MISFNVFKEIQSSIEDERVLQLEYEEYKKRYEASKSEYYFKEHESEEWFKEKYDPQYLEQISFQKSAQSQSKAQIFFEDISTKEQYLSLSAKLKLELKEEDEKNATRLPSTNLGHEYDAKALVNSIKITFGNKSNDQANENLILHSTDSNIIYGPPYCAENPDKYCIFLNHIGRSTSRKELYEIVSKLEGFVSLSLSEPVKSPNNSRYGWISLDSDNNTEKAIKALSEIKFSSNDGNENHLNPIRSKTQNTKRINVTPALFDERIQEDIIFSKQLIELLDSKSSITKNSLLESVFSKIIEDEVKLDIQIAYLRKVHCFCYYCAQEFDNEKLISQKCGNVHVRHFRKIGSRSNSDTNPGLKEEIEWDRWFTDELKKEIEKLEAPKIDESLQIKRAAFINKHIVQLQEEKFKCELCPKQFKGLQFAKNHIINRHPDIMFEAIDKHVSNHFKSSITRRKNMSFFLKTLSII